MGMLRGVRVHAEKHSGGQTWHWLYLGARYDFRMEPKFHLLRNGNPVAVGGIVRHLLCVDDAVLYSFGFEESTLYSHGETGGK